MHTGKVLMSAFVGTTAMTIFSYMVSESKNKNFREPQVLGQLINRLPQSGSKKSSQFAGWGLHYIIGTLFVVGYNKLWKKTDIKASLTSGALLGTASGVIGVIGWKGMFEGHPNAPAKKLKPFFGHLMLAHVVFGVFSAITHKLTTRNNKP